MTVKLDHQGKIPCFVVESNAREHDSKKIRDVPYQAGDVLVFDRGYSNYQYFKELCEAKVWFVTRLNSNAVYATAKESKVKEGGAILSDSEIILPTLSTQMRFRRVVSIDPETNKEIELLTNNLTWSSQTVASVYKDRWQIELFFKAIKQNLKIKRFYGNSKNAVMTQIWIALIAYLLFYLLKVKSKRLDLSFTNFISVIKTMLFQRVSLYDFLCGARLPPKPKLEPGKNLEFVW